MSELNLCLSTEEFFGNDRYSITILSTAFKIRYYFGFTATRAEYELEQWNSLLSRDHCDISCLFNSFFDNIVQSEIFNRRTE